MCKKIKHLKRLILAKCEIIWASRIVQPIIQTLWIRKTSWVHNDTYKDIKWNRTPHTLLWQLSHTWIPYSKWYLKEKIYTLILSFTFRIILSFLWVDPLYVKIYYIWYFYNYLIFFWFVFAWVIFLSSILLFQAFHIFVLGGSFINIR